MLRLSEGPIEYFVPEQQKTMTGLEVSPISHHSNRIRLSHFGQLVLNPTESSYQQIAYRLALSLHPARRGDEHLHLQGANQGSVDHWTWGRRKHRTLDDKQCSSIRPACRAVSDSKYLLSAPYITYQIK